MSSFIKPSQIIRQQSKDRDRLDRAMQAVSVASLSSNAHLKREGTREDWSTDRNRSANSSSVPRLTIDWVAAFRMGTTRSALNLIKANIASSLDLMNSAPSSEAARPAKAKIIAKANYFYFQKAFKNR